MTVPDELIDLYRGKKMNVREARRYKARQVQRTRGFGNRKARQHKEAFRRHKIAQGWRQP